eukprot:15474005-Heterocapsa_arctica.AAC.1
MWSDARSAQSVHIADRPERATAASMGKAYVECGRNESALARASPSPAAADPRPVSARLDVGVGVLHKGRPRQRQHAWACGPWAGGR